MCLDNFKTFPKYIEFMLEDFIETNKVDAKLIPLKDEVRSVADAVRATGIPAENHAKSILFIDSNKEPVLVVLLGSDKVSTAKMKELLNVKDVRLADKNEIQDITGYEVGGVPPISIYGVKTIIDKKVLEREKVACGGGNTRTEMIIATKHIQEFAIEPIIEDVAV
jgi:prolyl-tRNA editing enzyme YbaK/EbsC (Cys-tRNA(Pro) deacylase)